MPYSKSELLSHTSSGSYENMNHDSNVIVYTEDQRDDIETLSNPNKTNKFLERTIQELPTVFSNFHLADHQIQAENIENINNKLATDLELTSYKNINLKQTEKSSSFEEENVTPKKPILKKIMSYLSFDGIKIVKATKESYSSKLDNISSKTEANEMDLFKNRKPEKLKKSISNSADNDESQDTLGSLALIGHTSNTLNLSKKTLKVSNAYDDYSSVVTTTTTIFEYNPKSVKLSNLNNQLFSSWSSSFFNNKKQNYKDKIKSMNVRRKSSLIQETCFKKQPKCDQTNFLKSKNSFLKRRRFAKSSMELNNELKKNEESFLYESIIHSASKRGSIHYHSYFPCDSRKNAVQALGLIDQKEFRQKLEMLEEQHRNFDIVSNDFLSTRSIRIRKRKRAFDAISLKNNDLFDFDVENHFNVKCCPEHMVSSLVS